MVPKGWQRRTLEQITVEKISYGIVQAGPHCDNGVPYLKSSDVGSDIDVASLQKTEPEIHYQYRRSAVRPGHIVFSLRGNLGATSIVPDELSEANLTQGTARIAVNSSNDVYFVRYQLANDFTMRLIERVSKGSTFKEISLESLRKIPLALPPLPEQRKIAQILSTWDKVIATTERLLANKQQQKKALMQRLLTGKQRFAGFEGEWQRVHIKDCTTCLDNKRVPLNSEQRNAMKGPIPYWGANSVMDYVNDFIFDDDLVLLAEDGGYFDEFETRPIANLSRGKCWVNNHAHILKTRHNCLTEWLYYSLVHKNILAYVNTGTRAKLNKSDMLMIPILLPTIAEQRKIVSILAQADNELGSLSARLENLKLQKKALMQQLLTGKRRVKIDEAAA